MIDMTACHDEKCMYAESCQRFAFRNDENVRSHTLTLRTDGEIECHYFVMKDCEECRL